MSYGTKQFISDREVKALAKRISFILAPREVYGTDDKCFTVTVADIVIGHVYACMETLERKPKGCRYVTKRWQRPCWRFEPARPHRELRAYNFAFRSKIRAAVDLVSFMIEPEGLLAGVAAKLVREVEREADAAFKATVAAGRAKAKAQLAAEKARARAARLAKV